MLKETGLVLGLFVASLLSLFSLTHQRKKALPIERFPASEVFSESTCAKNLVYLALLGSDRAVQLNNKSSELRNQLASVKKQLTAWSTESSLRAHSRNEIDDFRNQILGLQDSVVLSQDPMLRQRYIDAVVAIDEYRERPGRSGVFSKMIAKTRVFLSHSFLMRPLGAVSIRNPRVAARIDLKIKELEISDLSSYSNTEIEEAFRRLSFLRSLQEETHNPKFKQWLSVNRPWEDVVDDSQATLGEFYSMMRTRFRSESGEFLSDKETAEDIGKQATQRDWDRYEGLRGKTFNQIDSIKNFDALVVNILESYKSLDTDFKAQDFYVWLHSKQQFSGLADMKRTKGNESVGDWLKREYLLFAPYSKQPMKLNREAIAQLKNQASSVTKKIVDEIKTCEGRSCYADAFQKNFSAFLRSSPLLRPFSCLRKNPLVFKQLVIDTSIAFSALTAYYFSHRDRFDRFPAEMAFNAVLLSPPLTEAYCRASFRSSLSFGAKLASKDVFPSGTRKAKAFKSNMMMLMKRGALFSSGLVGFGYTFDQLYLAMGGEILGSTALKDHLLTLPFIFLHAGVWSSAKNLAVINPIRHKLIPKLSSAMAERLGKRKWGVGIHQLLDIAAYAPISKYNSWEYLWAYKQQIMPALMGYFGIAWIVGESTDENAAGAEVVPVAVEAESIVEGDQSVQVRRKLSNGIESSVEVEKLEDGYVRLKSVDIDIPDEVLEQLVDQATQSVE